MLIRQSGIYRNIQRKRQGNFSETGNFDDGISYSFSSEESILHGEYIVLASCAECFETKYGFPPHGEFSGNLKNSGERIALKDLSKESFLSIEYSDKGPWPEKADGLGYSLCRLYITGI